MEYHEEKTAVLCSGTTAVIHGSKVANPSNPSANGWAFGGKSIKGISIANNGKVILAKGIKKGNYTLIVEVKAMGTSNYKGATRNVTAKIIVK